MFDAGRGCGDSARGAMLAAAVWLALGAADARAQAHDTQHEHSHAEPAPDAGYVVPPISAEDRAAAFPETGPMPAHGMLEDPLNAFVLLDRLELAEAHGAERLEWDVSAWFGRSLRRLWLRSEGERHGGTTRRADVEILGGIAVARWWDVVGGVRRDFEPGPGRTWAAFGVQGLAPYGFEVEATAYFAEGGRSAARVEAAHELPITPRLIVEPSLELDWHGASDRERGIGRGLSRGEVALRVRYEIRREIAPYLGIVREMSFGETEKLERAANRDPNDTMLVAGIRLWF